MTKLNRFLAIIVSSTLMLTFTGCSSVEKTTNEIKNTVVATVNDEPITLGDVDSNLGLILDQVITYYGNDYKNNEDALLFLSQKRFSMVDTLINDIIFKNKAIELGIMPSEEELSAKAKEQLDNIKKTFVSEEEYQTALTKTKFTEKQLIDELKCSVIYELVFNESTKEVKPTNKEIQKYYEETKSTYTLATNKVKPAHILVSDAITAKEIIVKLDNGANFAELANQYSIDDTKDMGGDLGWLEYSSKSVDSSILATAKELNIGEYSDTPVQTQFGFHVIMCLDKEIFPIQPLDVVINEVTAKVLEDKRYTEWTDLVKIWQDEANIKLYKKELIKLY